MNDIKKLISITPSGHIGGFKVEPDGVMVVPGVALHDLMMTNDHSSPTKNDEGTLSINSKILTFEGKSSNFSIPLPDVVRVQPFETDIDIYQKGRKKPFKFAWGSSITMKMEGIAGDDGKIKPLSARIVAQFIINERNKIGNLFKFR